MNALTRTWLLAAFLGAAGCFPSDDSPNGQDARVHQADPSLVLHYTFDQYGLVVRDLSARMNDGVLHGTVPEPDGGTYRFNGMNAYIQAGHPPSLDITRNLTLSAWFRKTPKTFGAPHQLQAIVGKDDGPDMTGRSYMMYVFDMPDCNKIGFSYGVPCGGVDGRHDIEAPLSLADGAWHHLAAIHESGVGNKLFVDGKCVAEDTEASPLPSTPVTDVLVGKTQAWEPWFFFGEMDDVRIYNRALTAVEIAALSESRR